MTDFKIVDTDEELVYLVFDSLKGMYWYERWGICFMFGVFPKYSLKRLKAVIDDKKFKDEERKDLYQKTWEKMQNENQKRQY